MKKIENKFVLLSILLFILYPNLNAKDGQVYESQSNLLFKNKELLHIEQSVSLEVDFNNAVMHLENEEYLQAISLFKRTAKVLKIPSFLNIGIAYYKLKSMNNAFLYLKKIYDLKETAKEDTFSYISATFYLYLITKDRNYIANIIKTSKTITPKQYTENVKRLLIDAYIVLKDYPTAIKISLSLQEKDPLKLALLYIKTNELDKANIYLDTSLQTYSNDEMINTILWLKTFADLKLNNLSKIKDDIGIIQKKGSSFDASKKLPIKIFFNPKKYDSGEYFKRVTEFSPNRSIDMIFYFAPFIFVDKKEIYTDSTLGFVLKNKDNIESLDLMIEYNKQFVDVSKEDPITRTIKLQKMVDAKTNVKSYEYYNLGLSYAHNFDFRNGYKYFKRAYDLSRSNKLYAAMAMICATRGEIQLSKQDGEKLKANLLSNDGSYKYLGKYIYKVVYDNKFNLDGKNVSNYDRESIFLRGLDFLDSMKKNKTMKGNEPLLGADIKDPMVYLFRSLVQKPSESKYKYIARLQDTLPKSYNDYFLKGPPLITQYYIEIVKSLGIYKKIDFNIKNERTPSYLRTKAIVQLYDGFPKATARIMESLQKQYNLNDIYTLDLLSAAYLSMGDESNAMATIGELQFEYNDNNAKFLSGVQLLQNLKFNSASQLFTKKYDGFFIDFEVKNIDDFLESL
ncbi:MAG: hypothetical protein PHF17_03355 [Arcobacteraceae bacterium]|nr:hypothetical protein [Arcobacteraceae bacterium]